MNDSMPIDFIAQQPAVQSGILNLPAVLSGLLLLIIWSISWKGVALWRAGRSNQKWWFIALMLVNTVGILEIIYLVFFWKGKK